MDAMRYCFPFDRIKRLSDVILYGDGKIMEDFLGNIEVTGYCNVVAIISSNKNYNLIKGSNISMISPMEINEYEYDYIIVAYEEKEKEGLVVNQLQKRKIDPERIVCGGDCGVNVYCSLDTSTNEEILYLFPFEQIAYNSKVIIYGAGDVARQFLGELETIRYCNIVAVVDKKHIMSDGISIISPEDIYKYQFDYVVIAVNNLDVTRSITQMLLSMQIPKEKIINASWRWYKSRRVGKQAIVKKEAENNLLDIMALEYNGLERIVRTNNEANNIKSFVLGKKIAIVGNDFEIKEYRGTEIDAHDIVVRLDNFNAGMDSAIYGSRADICIVNDDRVEICNFSPVPHFVILAFDIKKLLSNAELFADLSSYAKVYPQMLLGIDSDYINQMCEESNVHKYSSAFFAIYYFYKMLGNLDKVDFYGISIVNDENNSASAEYKFINGIYNNNRHSKKIKKNKLYISAYRSSTSYGGAGAVCNMTRKIIGSKIRNYDIRYIFNNIGPREKVKNLCSDFNYRNKLIMYAADAIVNNSEIKQSIEKNENVKMVCHDIGSAYGAFILGVSYVVVYHQQGSTIEEIRAANESYNDQDLSYLKYIEETVFSNAHKIYFPSLGAKKVFLETTLMSDSYIKKCKFADIALYNTIVDSEAYEKYTIQSDDEVRMFLLTMTRKHCYEEIFISVGDYNISKGIDLVPSAISEYVRMTNKKVLWIALGAANNVAMYNELQKARDTWNFDSFLFGRRIPHDKVYFLLNLADYYIMMHRKSIFDLATLEAMKAGKCIILSDIPGNREFNVMNNVLLIDEEKIENDIKKIKEIDKETWSNKNLIAFDRYFSNKCFKNNYTKMITDLIQSDNQKNDETNMNEKTFSKYKNKYKGKTFIICNSINFTEHIDWGREDTIYIATDDRAYVGNEKKFNFAFVKKSQDDNRLMTREGNNQSYEIISEKGVDDLCLTYDIDKEYICDAGNVLFSAIEFSVFSGAVKVILGGVDPYTAENRFLENLVSFKKQLTYDNTGVKLELSPLEDESLQRVFNDIDMLDNTPINVIGLYTNLYRKEYELQRDNCKDNYVFDFDYISDDVWNSYKTSEECAFWGGNTLKVECVINKIKKYWGQIIIVADADLVFLRDTKQDILNKLVGKDALFLRERKISEQLYERAKANVNMGFMVFRCNDKSLSFWKLVLAEVKYTKGWDQEVINDILFDGRGDLSFSILPETYLNGGSITIENLKEQHICTGCGTIAQRLKMTKYDFLKRSMDKYEKGEWF